MPHQAFLQAVAGYWKALGQPGEPPELGDSKVDAVIDLLHVTAGASHAFVLLDMLEDPYRGIAAGDTTRPWRLHWAIALSEMEPFVSPADSGLVFLIDTIADPEGKHRVYSVRDGFRGDLEFPNLAAALEWMTAQVRHAKGELTADELKSIQDQVASVLSDPWEDAATSGMFILEELLDTPLLEAWDAISRGQWPVVEGGRAKPPVDREDGWQRRLSLWLTRRFLAARRVELPEEVSVSDMDAVHRALADHLVDFEQAIHAGEIPGLIERLSHDPDASLAALAQAWSERHDSWRTAAALPSPEEELGLDDEEQPPPFQHTPFTRRLMQALSVSLDRMVERDEIELNPDRKEALLIELVTAGSDARSVKHMLKKITNTLVESEHVDEIYPTDERIQDRLREDLGG